MWFVILLLLVFNVSPSWALGDVTGPIKLREIYETPERLLNRLDSLEKSGFQPTYKIDFLRSYAYYSMSRYSIAYEYALSTLKDERVKEDETLYNRAIILLAENAIYSYRIEEACNIVTNVLLYAEENGNEVLTGNMLFMEGLLYRKINSLDKSYEYLNRAIEILGKRPEIGTLLRISQIRGVLCDVYVYDNKYDEAWKEARKREVLLRDLRSKGESLTLVDRQETYLYSRLAYLSHKQGRYVLANEYYHKFLKTNFSKNKLGLLDINDYLLELGNYQEVIDNNKLFFLNVDMDDVVSVIYQRALRQSAVAYEGTGNYKWAYTALEKLSEIKERHRLTIDRQFILDRYDTAEILRYKQVLEKVENDLSKRHNLLIFFVIVTVLLLVLFAWVSYDHKRLNSRNKKITSLLLELREAKEETEQYQMENIDRVPQDNRLFLQFDEKVRNEKLYLNYQMQRDDFARLMGVDRNRFASIIKEYTGGGNLNSYLNDMRLEYSIYLLKNHPEMSIQEIGEASALPSSTTFYRLFKEKYDISPKVFREQLK
ncbi:helix-turn-helix domain-containing protein [Bacteroides caecigallinarum]|uniref:helix-turn-helix domain-containing protein n=1 Tax=Bacteroides caecigallinarum TaxID=1411144 RepID=UPI001957E980|nr:helix-turn-helix domain-containing protein [Bacteroides caecigallinarum]MBM6864545.1 helix-turn-helix domain-containing protein [Bacteroides caecigallinarum]